MKKDFFNIIKAVACVCVLFIHVEFPGKCGIIIKSLSEWAVPFFLMVSGYFVFECDLFVVKKG